MSLGFVRGSSQYSRSFFASIRGTFIGMEELLAASSVLSPLQCSNILLRELALASAQDWSPAAPGTARAAVGLLEHLSDASLLPSEELAAVRMVDADTLEGALLEKREWVSYTTHFRSPRRHWRCIYDSLTLFQRS